jgi:hypothetical protein
VVAGVAHRPRQPQQRLGDVRRAGDERVRVREQMVVQVEQGM